MKLLHLALLLSAATLPLAAQQYLEPPAVPATAPNADFPVHLRILNVHWNHVPGGFDGYGRADLIGASPQGVDYTFSCSQPFLHNMHATEFYQARWKKPNQKLEILMQKVGTDHLQHCDLKVSVKPEPYGHYEGATPAPAANSTPPAPQP